MSPHYRHAIARSRSYTASPTRHRGLGGVQIMEPLQNPFCSCIGRPALQVVPVEGRAGQCLARSLRQQPRAPIHKIGPIVGKLKNFSSNRSKGKGAEPKIVLHAKAFAEYDSWARRSILRVEGFGVKEPTIAQVSPGRFNEFPGTQGTRAKNFSRAKGRTHPHFPQLLGAEGFSHEWRRRGFHFPNPPPVRHFLIFEYADHSEFPIQFHIPSLA